MLYLEIILTNFANMQIVDYITCIVYVLMQISSSQLKVDKRQKALNIFYEIIRGLTISYFKICTFLPHLCALIYTFAVLFVILCIVCVVIKRFVVLKVSFICRGVLAVSAEVVCPLLELSTGLREISQCPETGLFPVESAFQQVSIDS